MINEMFEPISTTRRLCSSVRSANVFRSRRYAHNHSLSLLVAFSLIDFVMDNVCFCFWSIEFSSSLMTDDRDEAAGDKFDRKHREQDEIQEYWYFINPNEQTRETTNILEDEQRAGEKFFFFLRLVDSIDYQNSIDCILSNIREKEVVLSQRRMFEVMI